MIAKLSNQRILQDYHLFMENFPTPPSVRLEYFHPVQFPVVITEAKVVLREVQDYSVLSLLILRLYDAGITDPEAIQSISGMSLGTILAYIKKEQFILEHIDPETNKLTKAGRETLKANEDLEGGIPGCMQRFDSVLRVQIDPLTASLIPQYLEGRDKFFDNIIPNEDFGDFLLPRESAPTDIAFENELNERLRHDINETITELVDNDVIKNGNLLELVEYLKPVRIFYRWGYLSKFEGMRSPMIVFSGKKTVEDSNARSLASGAKDTYVAVPVVLSETDSLYLARNGIFFPGVVRRSDSCFDYLISSVRKMNLTLPDLSDCADAEESASTYDESVEATDEDPEYESSEIYEEEPDEALGDESEDESDDEYEDEEDDGA